MYAHNVPIRLARALAPRRRAAGALVTLALLSAACSNSDPASRINAPSLLASMDKNPPAAASNFTVLAKTEVTCTGGTITGNVGTFQAASEAPPGKVTLNEGCLIIAGTAHVGDGAAKSAYNAFVAEYNALAPKLGECTTANTITGTLAGARLSRGVYCVSAEAKTGVLTLTGNGPWTFKVLGALTGTGFSVVMPSGGNPCNVTWWVAAAATMTDSHFIGTILAGAGITLTRGTFDGNAWSQADVTTKVTAVTGCKGGKGNGEDKDKDKDKDKCNQGVGNGSEDCDPGNSNHRHGSNDEDGGTPGDPGRKGGH